MVEAYSKQFNIDKLKWIVRGGASVQESIRNGVEFLADKISEEDNVIIHDGIRPLIDADVLTDVIDVCNRYGNAVTSLPYNEQIFVISQEDASTTKQYVPRNNCAASQHRKLTVMGNCWMHIVRRSARILEFTVLAIRIP